MAWRLRRDRCQRPSTPDRRAQLAPTRTWAEQSGATLTWGEQMAAVWRERPPRPSEQSEPSRQSLRAGELAPMIRLRPDRVHRAHRNRRPARTRETPVCFGDDGHGEGAGEDAAKTWILICSFQQVVATWTGARPWQPSQTGTLPIGRYRDEPNMGSGSWGHRHTGRHRSRDLTGTMRG